METVRWQVGAEDADARLDRVIANHLEDLSRSYAAGLIERGLVFVNNSAVTKSSQKVRLDDIIEVQLPEPEPTELQAEDIPLTIVYEDADLLVVDKPAGMVVHPAPGHGGGTLVNALLGHVPHLELDIGGESRPGIVHRLDKDTSGLIVVAKKHEAHQSLASQMSRHLMLKEYLTVVLGTPKPHAGIIDAPIARDPRDRQRMAVVENGRAARTRYWVERNLGKSRYTLLKVQLETGRTHQIRVHMAATGHPILGDTVYGKSTLKDAGPLELNRQFLHAHRLGFTLPSSGEYREFSSGLPPELNAVLLKLEGSLEF